MPTSPITKVLSVFKNSEARAIYTLCVKNDVVSTIDREVLCADAVNRDIIKTAINSHSILAIGLEVLHRIVTGITIVSDTVSAESAINSHHIVAVTATDSQGIVTVFT